MSKTLRIVTSVKGRVEEVWGALAQARVFVVSPYASVTARFDRNAELIAGGSLIAKLFAGPWPLSDPWVVQTHDRNGGQLSTRGAEGFDDKLLWDYEILVGDDGARSIVDYRVRLPRRNANLRGISVGRMFDRRHLSIKAMLLNRIEVGQSEITQAQDQGNLAGIVCADRGRDRSVRSAASTRFEFSRQAGAMTRRATHHAPS